MADPADIANDLIEIQILNTLRSRANTPIKIGPEYCNECEEEIPMPRRKLGFALCVPCAEESERRRSMFAGD